MKTKQKGEIRIMYDWKVMIKIALFIFAVMYGVCLSIIYSHVYKTETVIEMDENIDEIEINF